MKKICLLFLITSLIFPLSFKKVSAQTADPQARIQSLQQEIQRLSQLIANLRLVKEINAKSYLVINLSDSSIILEKEKDQKQIPASTTKLMTAVVAIENLDLDQRITLNQEMLLPLGWSPALYLGLSISAKNLLKASLIQSANDAAYALTFFVEKSEFLNLMNQKAKDLAMSDTVFFDSTGLSPNSKTTAQDIAKLLSYIYQSHPEILETTKNNDFWLPGYDGRMLKFKNINRFYEIPEFVGGKTGYLKKAGETLASIFRIKEKPLTIILFSSKDRQADVIKILNWLKTNPSL